MARQKESSINTVLFLTVFIYLVGFGLIIPILPVIGREFGASAFVVGLLMSVFSFFQFVFAPIWGRLSDRFGRRPILLTSLFFEGLCYVALFFAKDLLWLFVVRAFSGIFAASISTATAVVSDVTTADQRSKGMALIGAAFGLGFILGPAIGAGLAFVSESFPQWGLTSLQLCALGVAALCVATFLFAYVNLPETRAVDSSQSQLPRKSRMRMLYGTLTVWPSNQFILIFAVQVMAFSMIEASLVLFMADRFQWGHFEVSSGFVYIGLLSAFTQGYLVRKLLPIYGEKVLLTTGVALMAAAFLLVAIANQVWIVAVAMTLLSVGHSFVNPTLLGVISLLSNAREQGEAMGSTQGISSLSRIIGPALGGLFYAKVGMVTPFIVAGCCCLFSLIWIYRNRSYFPSGARQ